jgi:hypothetical protein
MCFASWMISDAVCDAEILLADVIHVQLNSILKINVKDVIVSQ